MSLKNPYNQLCMARTAAIALLMAALALPGCSPAASPVAGPLPAAVASGTAQPKRPAGAPKTFTLGVAGYNYTNRYIDSFSVDGVWGGNLDVSGPTTVGGGTCCFAWNDAIPLPTTVRVKWVSGGCRFLSKPNLYGERFPGVQHYYSEKEVSLSGPIPADPGYIEVHFYPDGRIEAAITTLPSEPRLKLSEDRAVDPYPETCKVVP